MAKEKTIRAKYQQESDWTDGGDFRCHTFTRSLGGKHIIFWRVFWGLFFLVAAGAVLAQIFGWLTFSINIWWLILGIFLLAIMVASIINLNWFGVFVPAACMTTIINYQTNWFDLNLTGQKIGGLFAVAVLLTIAFSILFHRKSYREIHRWVDNKHGSNHTSRGDREVTVSARLGEAVRHIESKKLERVYIDCVMGSVKVYFSGAKLVDNKLTIHVNCSLGGVELHVPRNWRVASGLDASLGGVSKKNHAELKPNSPTVHLTGNVNLGGVEIIYI
jgi:predicted membrane protein